MSEAEYNHPADRLASIRRKIKALQEDEAVAKADCEALPEGEREGRWFEVRVTDSERTTLDTKALKAALGEAALAPFQKTSASRTVTVKEIGA